MNLKITLLFGLLLLFVSCSENIVSECETDITTDGPVTASFADINERVLQVSCATSGCHAGQFAQSPRLDENTYNNLVDVASTERPSMDYVEPGDSENSWLMKKLLGEGTTIMPSGGPKLDDAIIDSIRVWIDNGAMNN